MHWFIFEGTRMERIRMRTSEGQDMLHVLEIKKIDSEINKRGQTKMV